MNRKILFYAIKYQGDFFKISKAILNNEKVEEVDYDGKYITILDKEYPEKLLRLKYKPWILFYEGKIELLKQMGIGIVGSRIDSEEGKRYTKIAVSCLSDKYTIISGLAKGIDTIAHKESIKNNRKTIGILGCGIDVIYPKENHDLYLLMKKNHLILSEYPKGVKPYAHHFPWRNRIIAALSEGIIVVEAKQRSGTLITVNEALEIGLPIYCFPYRFDDQNGAGCNMLIQQGSNIINSLQDIKEI